MGEMWHFVVVGLMKYRNSVVGRFDKAAFGYCWNIWVP